MAHTGIYCKVFPDMDGDYPACLKCKVRDEEFEILDVEADTPGFVVLQRANGMKFQMSLDRIHSTRMK